MDGTSFFGSIWQDTEKVMGSGMSFQDEMNLINAQRRLLSQSQAAAVQAQGQQNMLGAQQDPTFEQWNKVHLRAENAKLKNELTATKAAKTKEKSMFSEVTSDARNFVRSHKQVIYWIAIVYVIDYFFLNGVLKQRLSDLAHKLLGKIEGKLHEDTTTKVVGPGKPEAA